MNRVLLYLQCGTPHVVQANESTRECEIRVCMLLLQPLSNPFFALHLHHPFSLLIALGHLTTRAPISGCAAVLAGNSDPILILDCCASSHPTDRSRAPLPLPRSRRDLRRVMCMLN